MNTTHITEATIEADPSLPIIRITRDFAAAPAQLLRAHTDPDLFAQWVGPNGMDTRIIEWDARDGGCWRYVTSRDGQEYGFRGCFHQISDDRIVQTFTFEPMPDDVALETLRFEDLGDGRTRLHAQSLVESFESRDAWIASGMESGVNEGYAKLDDLLKHDPVAMRSYSARFTRVADAFTQRVDAVPAGAWGNTAPCEGWVARDVVRHLVEWVPGFFAGTAGLAFPPGPSVDDDAPGAWHALRHTLDAFLTDPDVAQREIDGGPIGRMTIEQAIDMIVTNDVFLHTWDLARATGLDERLDPHEVQSMYEAMEPMDEVLRNSGHYGPRVPVADDADPQTKLIAFIGRTP